MGEVENEYQMAHGVDRRLNSGSPSKNRVGAVAAPSLDNYKMHGFKDD